MCAPRDGVQRRVETHLRQRPAAIFITLMIPGNLRFQFYSVQSPVPTFLARLSSDGLAVREMIARLRRLGAAGEAGQLDVTMVPGLKPGDDWGR